MGDWYGYATAAAGSSGKTLTQLKTICKYYGWNDSTATGTAALTNFINDTLQMLATLAPWPWYFHRDGSVTYPTKATAIASIAVAGGTVTITTSAAHGFAAGDIVTITGSDNYDEASVTLTAAATTVTFTYTSSSTGATSTGTATLDDNDFETLTQTNIVRVGTLVRTDRSSPLDELTVEDWLLQKRYHAGTGPPTLYALRKSTSSGAITMEMVVYPEPTTGLTMYFSWYSHPNVLSGATDKTDWPDILLWLLSAALHKRLSAIDRDVVGVELRSPEFNVLVNRAYGQARPSYKPVIAAKPVMGHRWRLRNIEKTIVT